MLPTESPFAAEALERAMIGAWWWDRATGRVVWNSRLEQLFGLQPGMFPGTFDAWLALIHPEDRRRTLDVLERAIDSKQWFRFDHRCVWPDGSVHWLEGRGDVLTDEAGEVVGGAGITIDIDSRQATDDENRRLLESLRLARDSAEGAWRRLARLQAIAVKLSGASTVDEVGALLVADGSEVLNADGGFFSTVDDERKELVLRAARGAGREVVAFYQAVPLDAPVPPAEVARTGEPVFVCSHQERRRRFPEIGDQGAAAFAVIPLSRAGMVVAVLAFGFVDARTFSGDDRELLATIAGMSMQALHRAELYDVTQRAAVRAAQLERVTTRLTGAESIRQVGDVVVEELLPVVGAVGGSLFLVDEATSTLRAVVIHGYGPEVAEAYEDVHIEDETPAGEAFRTGRPIFIESESDWDGRYPSLEAVIADSGIRSVCQLPLVVDDRAMGTLGFGFASQHRFDAEERQHLGIVAAICGQALGRAMALDAARRVNARLASIDEITDAALSQLPLDDLVEELPRRVAGSIGCDVVRILLLEEDGSHLREYGWHGSGNREPTLIPIGRGLAGRVAATGAPIVFDDISQHEVVNPSIPDTIKTVAGFPLKSGGQVIGVLDVGAGADRPFTDDDLEILELAGDRIAVAIERSRAFEIERAARRRSEFMGRLGDVINQAGSLRAVARDVAHLAIGILADWCILTVITDDGTPIVAAAHSDPALVESAGGLAEVNQFDASAEAGPPAVIRTGRTEFYPVIDESLHETIADRDLRQAARDLDLRSSITVALRGSSTIVGAMQLVNAGSSARFGPDDVALAEDLAARIGVAIEGRLSLARHREAAMTLQRSLLPAELPHIVGAGVATRYWPASDVVDVGGDFFDVIELSPAGWGILIGDVSGKGVAAAAMTGIARYTARAAGRHGYGPTEVLRWIHDAFLTQSETTESFCSALYGVLETVGDHHRFRFAVGGHPLPIVRRAGGPAQHVGSRGTVLGLIDPVSVSMSEIALHNGDWLVLYTDGVTDVPVDDAITEDELLHIVEDVCVTTPENALESLDRVLVDRYGDLSNRDDTAVLIIKCTLDAPPGGGGLS